MFVHLTDKTFHYDELIVNIDTGVVFEYIATEKGPRVTIIRGEDDFYTIEKKNASNLWDMLCAVAIAHK